MSKQKNRNDSALGFENKLWAAAEGKLGGQFYTPQCVVCTLAEMLEPYHGRVLDPCCGSGGMFVQVAKFIEAHATRAHLLMRTQVVVSSLARLPETAISATR